MCALCTGRANLGLRLVLGLFLGLGELLEAWGGSYGEGYRQGYGYGYRHGYGYRYEYG